MFFDREELVQNPFRHYSQVLNEVLRKITGVRGYSRPYSSTECQIRDFTTSSTSRILVYSRTSEDEEAFYASKVRLLSLLRGSLGLFFPDIIYGIISLDFGQELESALEGDVEDILTFRLMTKSLVEGGMMEGCGLILWDTEREKEKTPLELFVQFLESGCEYMETGYYNERDGHTVPLGARDFSHYSYKWPLVSFILFYFSIIKTDPSLPWDDLLNIQSLEVIHHTHAMSRLVRTKSIRLAVEGGENTDLTFWVPVDFSFSWSQKFIEDYLHPTPAASQPASHLRPFRAMEKFLGSISSSLCLKPDRENCLDFVDHCRFVLSKKETLSLDEMLLKMLFGHPYLISVLAYPGQKNAMFEKYGPAIPIPEVKEAKEQTSPITSAPTTIPLLDSFLDDISPSSPERPLSPEPQRMESTPPRYNKRAYSEPHFQQREKRFHSGHPPPFRGNNRRSYNPQHQREEEVSTNGSSGIPWNSGSFVRPISERGSFTRTSPSSDVAVEVSFYEPLSSQPQQIVLPLVEMPKPKPKPVKVVLEKRESEPEVKPVPRQIRIETTEEDDILCADSREAVDWGVFGEE